MIAAAAAGAMLFLDDLVEDGARDIHRGGIGKGALEDRHTGAGRQRLTDFGKHRPPRLGIAAGCNQLGAVVDQHVLVAA
ncbi:hypothetical protein D9M68_375250 [compost metagenome]